MQERDASLVEAALSRIRVRAWWMYLETPGVMATVPMLRGVWGAALHALTQEVYGRLFGGDNAAVPPDRTRRSGQRPRLSIRDVSRPRR